MTPKLTQRQTAILTMLRRYKYARGSQIRKRCHQSDRDGGATRALLRQLERAGYIRRYQPKMIDPITGMAPPVFALTIKGSCVLATNAGDTGLLLTVEPSFAEWMSINHYVYLTEVMAAIDDAFAAQTRVKMSGLVFEHDVLNPDARDPADHFRLYTRIDDKVVCVPDCAFETEIDGYRRAVYVEYETGADSPGRVWAKKQKGYLGLHEKQLFKKHFPRARDFRVLCCCPNESWREAIRKAAMPAERKEGQPEPPRTGGELWLFSTTQDVLDGGFLVRPIHYRADKGPLAFVPAPPIAPAGGGGDGCRAGRAEPTQLVEGK